MGEAPAPGSGGQEVVGSHGADAQEEDAEGSRRGRCRGPFRQRPTEEPSTIDVPPQLHPTHLTSTETSEMTRLRVVCEVLVGE